MIGVLCFLGMLSQGKGLRIIDIDCLYYVKEG